MILVSVWFYYSPKDLLRLTFSDDDIRCGTGISDLDSPASLLSQPALLCEWDKGNYIVQKTIPKETNTIFRVLDVLNDCLVIGICKRVTSGSQSPFIFPGNIFTVYQNSMQKYPTSIVKVERESFKRTPLQWSSLNRSLGCLHTSVESFATFGVAQMLLEWFIKVYFVHPILISEDRFNKIKSSLYSAIQFNSNSPLDSTGSVCGALRARYGRVTGALRLRNWVYLWRIYWWGLSYNETAHTVLKPSTAAVLLSAGFSLNSITLL